MTALAFRSERRPRTLPAHNREDTSMVAKSQKIWLLLPMKVQSSSACSSNEVEVAQHPVVEALRGRRGPLKPTRDGVAGMARDSGGRRNAHAFDAQACHLVELPSRAAKPAVGSPRVRAERSPAHCASVPPSSARLRRKRAIAHDVEARFSTVVAPWRGARYPVDRVHCSSVPGGETPSCPPRSRR